MRKWIKKDDSTFKKFNEGRLFFMRPADYLEMTSVCQWPPFHGQVFYLYRISLL